jgi:hypothetical protein
MSPSSYRTPLHSSTTIEASPPPLAATAPTAYRCHAVDSPPRGPFSPLDRAARLRPMRLFSWPRVAGRRVAWAIARTGLRPNTVLDLKFVSNCLTVRNCSKLWKSIEILRNVQKLKTKFHWNPLEQLYAVGLTKFIFVYYFFVENSKKSKLEAFICKNPCKMKSSNLAWVYTSYLVAHTRISIINSYLEYLLAFNLYFCTK